MPKRIQMSRQVAWRKDHPAAVIVDRRTKWGNPFAVGKSYGGFSHTAPGETIRDRAHAVEYFRRWLTATVTGAKRATEAATELRGRELACWCPLDQPCHADVLLELANPKPLLCPECIQGKPGNCHGETLNAADEWVPCATTNGEPNA